MKLTPKTEDPAYSQNLPCQINLNEDLAVELALLHYYGIITTLHFGLIFAQRKPNGKLQLLIDLKKKNNLISVEFFNDNHPVSTVSDAAHHLAGKKLFCKLEYSQAFQNLQMAVKTLVQLLVFNFSRT